MKKLKLFSLKIKIGPNENFNFIPDIFLLFSTMDCVPNPLKLSGDLKSHGGRAKESVLLNNCSKALDLKHI